LKEKVGHPYTLLPDDMMQIAAGGYADQGTLCGSLGACASIINLVTMDKDKTHTKLAADLINWYGQQSFPSTKFDAIATYKKQTQTTPNSPLCHVSVSGWMMETGTTYPDKQRKDRCAKVAAEVANHTVEILNAYADGSYKPIVAKLSESTESCLTCHGESAHDNAKGQMDCLTCHDDHTK